MNVRKSIEEIAKLHHEIYFQAFATELHTKGGKFVGKHENDNSWDSYDEMHRQATVEAFQRLVDEGYISIR